MKHRSISHTTTPAGYTMHPDPKKHTAYFNKWASYIHKEVKKLKAWADVANKAKNCAI